MYLQTLAEIQLSTVLESKKTKFRLNTLRYLGPEVWGMLPDDIKPAGTLPIFKK